MTLRVRLEIVPHGDESQMCEIGRLDISNTGDAPKYPPGVCEYKVRRYGPAGNRTEYKQRVIHAREDGAYALVAQAITELVLPNLDLTTTPQPK